MFNRDTLVCIDRECGIILALKDILKFGLYLIEADRLLLAIDMIREGVALLIVFDRDADGSFCRDLVGTLRQKELQCVRVDKCRCYQEENQQQEHYVCHRRH
jgi:hypothetical protein